MSANTRSLTPNASQDQNAARALPRAVRHLPDDGSPPTSQDLAGKLLGILAVLFLLAGVAGYFFGNLLPGMLGVPAVGG